MRPHNMILCALLCVFLTACAAAPAQEPPVSEASVQTAALPVPPEKTAAPAVSVVSKMRLPDAPVRRIVGNEYTAEVTEAEAAHEGYTLLSRRYAFSDGCTVEMHRADGMTDSVLFFSDLLPNIGEISFFDEAHNEWRHLPLQEGSWQTQIVMLRTDGGRNYFIYTPRTFTQHENQVLEHRTTELGTITLEKVKLGWLLRVTGSIREMKGVCDCLILYSHNPLENWDCDNCAKTWQRYLTDQQGHLCFDGYYFLTPSTYIPTGPEYYYRCVASYIVKATSGRIGPDPCAAPLTVASLDTVLLSQNDRGFWETTPVSSWLSEDYGIGAGFYDTRFNTDLMEIVYLTNNKLGGGLFFDTVETYLDFYQQMAEQEHFEKNGGWLIPDYWWHSPFTKPHTSLNHQAAECLQLYRLSDMLDREDIRQLADRLLLGILETADGYVMPDHNLHYCVRPDFSYGLDDYPYLTYNDLLALDRYLLEQRGEGEEKLEMLMAEKKLWMDANGVTAYNH